MAAEELVTETNGNILYTCGHKAESLGGSLNKWGLKELTYFINGYPTGIGLTKDDVDDLVKMAFGYWTEVCDLKFKRASDPNRTNFLMFGARGIRNNFDGPLGTLAWCELAQGPNFKGTVNLAWDLEEDWRGKNGGNQGIKFLNVTTHEIGHGIGLDHNNFPRQLMNPIYSAAIATPQQYDIADAVARYGKPVIIPVPPNSNPVPAPGVVWAKFLDEQGRVWGGPMSLLTDDTKSKLTF